MPCPFGPPTPLSLRDRLELLAFEAELAGFPRSLIDAVWEAIDLAQVNPTCSVSPVCVTWLPDVEPVAGLPDEPEA